MSTQTNFRNWSGCGFVLIIGNKLITAGGTNSMHLLAFFFFPIFGFGFVFYFLPAIVALARHKRDAVSILVLNLLLGWTMIGWVIALVWALKQDLPVVIR
jgi:hypothetical protein